MNQTKTYTCNSMIDMIYYPALLEVFTKYSKNHYRVISPILMTKYFIYSKYTLKPIFYDYPEALTILENERSNL